MKQWLWLPVLLVVFGMVGWLPLDATDVGQLKPVEVVCIGMAGDAVYVLTDTDDCGYGKDLTAAIEDLKRSTSGYVFLETAEYILLGEAAENMAEELGKHLRPGCSVCFISGEVPLKDVAVYLRVHEPAVTLQQWQSGGAVPDILQTIGGRFYLEAAKSNNKAMGSMDPGSYFRTLVSDCGKSKLV